MEGDRLKISACDKPGSSRLLIRKAEYGVLPNGKVTDVTTNVMTNVTTLVAEMVGNDALDVLVSSDNFGDPAVGIKKHLRVDYTIDGEERYKTAIDGARLKISASDKPVVPPSGSSKLVIRAAVFGDFAAGDTNDVTAIVTTLVTNDVLDVLVDTNSFGDPAPNVIKKLRIDYALNGQEKTNIVIEGDRLKISASDKPGFSRLFIRKAEFGVLPDGKAIDVTANVAAVVDNDALDVLVSSDSFGDPAPKVRKRLRVDYTFDGEERAKTVVEGDRLKISPSDKAAGIQKFHSSRLFIREADYGKLPDGNVNDVTAIVAAMVDNDALDVMVGSDNFDDPAPQVKKKLYVDYAFDGEERAKTVIDGARLKISASDKSAGVPKSSSSRLVIRKAEYGDLPDGNVNDITAIIAAMVDNDALDIIVGNFDDPAVGIKKHLRVDYSLDGVEGSKTAIDFARLKISASDKPAAMPPNLEP